MAHIDLGWYDPVLSGIVGLPGASGRGGDAHDDAEPTVESAVDDTELRTEEIRGPTGEQRDDLDDVTDELAGVDVDEDEQAEARSTWYPKCFLRANTGSSMDGGGSTDMTLAFELEALKRLARPEEVFSDARTWSEYVGVVSEKPTYVVTNFTRKNRIRQDFFSGPRGREESLENVRAQFDTERHVFVGVDDGDADLADDVDWEYLPVERAAGAADWELGDPEDDGNEADDDARDDWP